MLTHNQAKEFAGYHKYTDKTGRKTENIVNFGTLFGERFTMSHKPCLFYQCLVGFQHRRRTTISAAYDVVQLQLHPFAARARARSLSVTVSANTASFGLGLTWGSVVRWPSGSYLAKYLYWRHHQQGKRWWCSRRYHKQQHSYIDTGVVGLTCAKLGAKTCHLIRDPVAELWPILVRKSMRGKSHINSDDTTTINIYNLTGERDE